MDQPPESGAGLFHSLRRILDSGLALVQNRLRLLAVELQEEKVRFFDLVLRMVAILVLGLLALIAATAAVVVWLWDTCPVLVLGAVTMAYGIAAVLVWRDLQKRLQTGPPPFADTIAEFKKDRECLGKHD